MAAAFGAWAVARVSGWTRKDPAEIERLRRLAVNRRGRITAGRIVDLIEANRQPMIPSRQGRGAGGEGVSRLVLYTYEVAGAKYEAAQDISSLAKVVTAAQCLAGQSTSVKYDPKRPTNSIIVCEEWCGVAKSRGRESGIRG